MARDKRAAPPAEEGAPAWMVTYGDMMSLLLCFFIMLVAMSEIKEDKFKKILESMQKAFGSYELTVTRLPGHIKQDANSLLEKIRAYRTVKGELRMDAGALSINVEGEQFMSRTIRDGGEILTVGDRIGFPHGKYEMQPEMKRAVDILRKEFLKDYPNYVTIKGHAAAVDLPDGMNHLDLSYRRASAVRDYLVENGINPRRIRVMACGSHEAIASNLTPEGRASNRRVEIIVSEQILRDAIPGRGGI